MLIKVCLFGAALTAFCMDYPLNGHLVFAMIIVGYVVMHVVENLTKISLFGVKLYRTTSTCWT